MLEENPYLIFFLHLERYGLIPSFVHGDISYRQSQELAKRHNVSPLLVYKLACHSYRESKDESRKDPTP